MLKALSSWLKLPELNAVNDLDDPATTDLHAQIIKNKVFLKRIYTDFYREYAKVINANPSGTYIELGSGGGFIKELYPSVKTSDILCVSDIDLCFSAQDMPFKDDSVDAFFMINVFHHIKDPVHILNELNRSLRPGGKIIMIEPANTLWGRFIYQKFHHEEFDPSAGWVIQGDGPLSSANGAMPWIIFCRDKDAFIEKFQSLSINRIRYHSPIRYIISGGVSMRQLLPSFTYNIIIGIEFILSVFNRWTGMFFTIELQKMR